MYDSIGIAIGTFLVLVVFWWIFVCIQGKVIEFWFKKEDVYTKTGMALFSFACVLVWGFAVLFGGVLSAFSIWFMGGHITDAMYLNSYAEDKTQLEAKLFNRSLSQEEHAVLEGKATSINSTLLSRQEEAKKSFFWGNNQMLEFELIRFTEETE